MFASRDVPRRQGSRAGAAAPAPAWSLSVVPFPANFNPGEKGEYVAIATNVGGAATSASPAAIEVTLPAGLTPLSGELFNRQTDTDTACTVAGQSIRCETTEPVGPRAVSEAQSSSLPCPWQLPKPTFRPISRLKERGALKSPRTLPLPCGPTPSHFTFLPPLKAPGVNVDGSPATQAGAHPYQQNIDFGFPVRRADGST